MDAGPEWTLHRYERGGWKSNWEPSEGYRQGQKLRRSRWRVAGGSNFMVGWRWRPPGEIPPRKSRVSERFGGRGVSREELYSVPFDGADDHTSHSVPGRRRTGTTAWTRFATSCRGAERGCRRGGMVRHGCGSSPRRAYARHGRRNDVRDEQGRGWSKQQAASAPRQSWPTSSLPAPIGPASV